MCGIAGFSGDFDEGLLARMSEAIAHRGPDGDGSLCDRAQGVGLAHRRLAIIDPTDAGLQPMWDATRRAAIVYNGEIYNFPQLRDELLADGFEFRNHTDTEVLLNLYLRDGPAMLERLNGIFAFALWDPGERSLFIARDGLGVKPLYFTECGEGFLFASELKALLEHGGIPRDIDESAIWSYVNYLWCPAPRTPLRNVLKLEPGAALLVRDGRIERQWTHYDLPYTDVTDEPTAEEAAEQLAAELRAAVRRQLISDVPVGAFLSGGLDSSAVVALAHESGATDLACFTIAIQGGIDQRQGVPEDLPFARQVAAAHELPLHVVEVGFDVVHELQRMIYYLDEPQADLAPINALYISRLARENGIKVLLSGTGGDDILAGYRRHFALTQERRWAWLPRGARSALRHASSMLPENRAFGRRVARAFRFADSDEDERITGYFRWLDAATSRRLMGPRIRDTLGDTPPDPLMETLARLPDGVPALNRMLYLDAKHFLADHNLNYTDRAGMAEGVEIRVPLLDIEVIKLAARLPVGMKQRGTQGKWIFKKAMEGVLDNDIIYRPKTGFGVPLRQWMEGELGDYVASVLADRSFAERGLFDTRQAQRALAGLHSGRVDAAYPLLGMVCVELWCRTFIDGSTPAIQA